MAVTPSRRCSRSGCRNPAVATLTFAYAECTAVVGPLATAAEPHSYDLCVDHAANLTAPKGWDIVRPDSVLRPPEPGPADLEALADAVREVDVEAGGDPVATRVPAEPVVTGQRGHLRVLRFPEA